MRFLFIVLLAFTVARIAASCDDKNNREEDITDSEAVVLNEQRPDVIEPGPRQEADGETEWIILENDLEDQSYEEVKSPDIRVRSDKQRTVYSIDTDQLFTSRKVEIAPQWNDELEEIAASIRKRYPQGRVYVFSRPAGANQPRLQEEQAVEVKQWLVVNGHMDEARVFVYNGKRESPPAPDTNLDRGDRKGVVEIIAVNP